MTRRLAYFLGMQASWFACVLGAARDLPLVGPLAVLGFVTLHLAGVRNRWREAGLLVAAGVVGYLFDSVLVLTGMLTFPGHVRVGWPSPVWMVALWVNLAVTLHSTMDWLSRRYALAALTGAVLAPPAYVAGVRAGAAHLGGGASMFAIGALWALAMPLLVWLADRTRPVDEASGTVGGLAINSRRTVAAAGGEGLEAKPTAGD